MKALVIGATGATGVELINSLLLSKQWSEISILCRRKLKDWESYPMTDTEIKLVVMDDFSILNESKEKIIKAGLNLNNYNTVFNVLGSQVGKGEEEFRKVDYYYVVYSASLCEKFNIPHFSLLSSTGSNSKSLFLYLRVKGEVEEKLKSMNIKKLSIFKPGLIKNRKEERFGEKILRYLSYCCCCLVTSIECKDLAKAIGIEAEKAVGEGSFERSYSNSNIYDILNEVVNKKI